MPNWILRLTRAAGELWDSLDYVPDCPMCGGTGDRPKPGRENMFFTYQVYWKGRLYAVCAQCEGKGKV